MRWFLRQISISSLLLFVIFISPVAAFADTYGSGTYGNGAYGASSNSNSASSAITSVSNAISAFFCSNQAPSSAPDLYEIDVTNTTAKVYFTPAGGPYDSHFISYGQGNNSEQYGVNLSTRQTSGALFFTVEQLSSNTVYMFKVRGGNGCKPGPWSNTLTVQTLSQGTKVAKKFYPNHQAQYTQIPAGNLLTRAKNFVGSLLPGTPGTGFAPAKQQGTVSSQPVKSHQQVQTSLWGNVTHFFSNMFHGL